MASKRRTTETETETETENDAKKAVKPKKAASFSNDVPKALQDEGFKLANPDIFFYKPASGDVRPGDEPDPSLFNILRGIVIDRQERAPDPEEDGKGQTRYYYRIVLTAPAILYSHEGEPVQGERGLFAWVDERHDLRILESYLPRREGGGHDLSAPIREVSEVVIEPQRLIKVRKRVNGMWKIRVLNRSIAAARAGVPLLGPDNAKPRDTVDASNPL